MNNNNSQVRAQLTFHESQTIHMDWDEDQVRRLIDIDFLIR